MRGKCLSSSSSFIEAMIWSPPPPSWWCLTLNCWWRKHSSLWSTMESELLLSGTLLNKGNFVVTFLTLKKKTFNLQICWNVDNHRLHKNSPDELQESNSWDGGTGGTQAINLERWDTVICLYHLQNDFCCRCASRCQGFNLHSSRC